MPAVGDALHLFIRYNVSVVNLFHGRSGGIRTHTERDLSSLPLPLGYAPMLDAHWHAGHSPAPAPGRPRRAEPEVTGGVVSARPFGVAERALVELLSVVGLSHGTLIRTFRP